MAGLGAEIAAVEVPFQLILGFCVYIFGNDAADIVVSAESVPSAKGSITDLLLKIR